TDTLFVALVPVTTQLILLRLGADCPFIYRGDIISEPGHKQRLFTPQHQREGLGCLHSRKRFGINNVMVQSTYVLAYNKKPTLGRSRALPTPQGHLQHQQPGTRAHTSSCSGMSRSQCRPAFHISRSSRNAPGIAKGEGGSGV
ncbi:unnamed protein product, partial [Ectocarpus sp. 8 AP-2014]